MKLDILIAGVGGQGTIFASRVLSSYAISKGLNVSGMETVGAAQRGGSVSSHLRISDKEIFSTLIPRGSLDILLGFEEIETLRHMKLAKESTVYIMNQFRVPTAYTMMGIDRYPDSTEVLDAARRVCARGYVLQASEKAEKLGNIQSTNLVMIGALTKVEPFFVQDAIRKHVQELSGKLATANVKAFDEGYSSEMRLVERVMSKEDSSLQ
jgi:indolepyruvate ferredoxin oxidoreductase beta subunit